MNLREHRKNTNHSAGGGGEGEAAPTQPKPEQEDDQARKTPKKAKQAVKSVSRENSLLFGPYRMNVIQFGIREVLMIQPKIPNSLVPESLSFVFKFC